MKLTWFGQSAFRLEFGSAIVLIDPFLTGNPLFKGDVREAAAGATHVLVTHGHNDHLGDAVAICTANGAMAIGAAELCDWLNGQGVEKTNPGNHGGTVDCSGFTVSFVNALHSSSYNGPDGAVYLGNPLGLVVKAPGEKVIYHMGDTEIFGDMALIAELHRPQVGLVPIGDRYTMGGATAALACTRYFAFETIVPMHYRTFPGLDQTPDKFRAGLGDGAARLVVPEIGVPFEA